MSLPSEFSIAVMRDDEIATLWGWARDEGWNPGFNDLAIARRVDPEAFVALREGQALAAGGSIFRHDHRFGFMGLFIVRRDVRRRGLGRELWYWRRDRLIARLGPGATLGMDGVYEMVPFYERGGFTAAHRHLRFQGAASGTAHPDAIRLDAADVEEIDAFDRHFVVMPRLAFLREWIGQPGAIVVGIRRNGALAAYGVARACVIGFKIGPLFADAPEDARAVAQTLQSAVVAGQQMQMDVPDTNAAALAMARDFGMVETFGCRRLYHGPAPALHERGIFAVTSLEFG